MTKRICPNCKTEWFGSDTYYEMWKCSKCFAEIPRECEVPIEGGKQIETHTIPNY